MQPTPVSAVGQNNMMPTHVDFPAVGTNEGEVLDVDAGVTQGLGYDMNYGTNNNTINTGGTQGNQMAYKPPPGNSDGSNYNVGNGGSNYNFGNYQFQHQAGNGGMGMANNFQSEDESINYLAARAHAAQILAAEESRRLEENLMRLEMQRMMMGNGGSVWNGGLGPGRPVDQVRNSNDGSSGMSQQNSDGVPMPTAQNFILPNGHGMPNNSLPCMNPGNNATIRLSEGQSKAPDESDSAQKSHQQQSTSVGVPLIGMQFNAPRRPLSAYNIFFSEMRETILKGDDEDGEADAEGDAEEKECEKTVGEGEDQKGEERATGNESSKDMEQFTQNLMKKRLDRSSRRVHRKSHGKVAFTSLAKTVGKRWRDLPEAQKKKYNDLAEIDRARYQKEKVDFAKALKEHAKKQRKEAKAAQQNKA